ncbi:MAG: DUF308 domain-containing protein [Candidatus Nanopelagicales bacterium]
MSEPMDRLPEPAPQQYEQEWLAPQAQTVDVSRAFAGALTALAVVTGVFGAITLFWPSATLRVVAILFGLWLLFTGLVMLVQALAGSRSGGVRALLGLGGLVSLVVGGICIVNGDASVRILVLFVVIGWIVDGLAHLIIGIRAKGSPNRTFFLVFGALQLVLAVLVIAWPSATVTVMVRLIGVGLLLMAAFALWGASNVRKAGGQTNVVVIES